MKNNTIDYSPVPTNCTKWILPCDHKFQYSLDTLLNSYFVDKIKNSLVFPTSLSNDLRYEFENFTSIEVYAQPLQHPALNTMYSLVDLFIVTVGEIIGYKLLKMIKSEQRTGGFLIDQILTVMVVTQMAIYPLELLFRILNNSIYPLYAYVGAWFCDLFGFLMHLRIMSFMSHSLIAALMRYVFIVHQDKIMIFGEKKAKKIFLWISILFPTVHAFIYMISELDENNASGGIISLIKCHGHYSQHFVTSYNNRNSRVFMMTQRCRLGDIDFSSDPMLSALATLCFTSRASMVIIGSNLLEAILYCRTFHYIRR